jgi:RHS repeat-associated protein
MFQGREWIAELGIYDYRHRMYHPGLGRFMQTDPSGFDAGDMNLFRYCADDPVDLTDPMGMMPEQSYSGVVDVSFDSGLGSMSRDQKLQTPAYAGNLSFGNVDAHQTKTAANGKERYRLKLIPLEPGDRKGHYIAQRLQITDSGNPLAGDELSVIEHVISRDKNNPKHIDLQTSADKRIPATRKGVITDRVGPDLAPGPKENYTFKAVFGSELYQRGTRIGPISSTFTHVTTVVNGHVENEIIPLKQ